MDHLICGVRDAVAKKSWYAATASALALPDACAAIERPGRGVSTARYIAWTEAWVSHNFLDDNRTPFMSARDLFLLRCAYLHEGDFAISDATSQEPDDGTAMFDVLNRITLYAGDVDVVPTRGMTIISTPPTRTTSYSLGVADLSEWICSAAEAWLAYARQTPVLAARIERLAQTARIIHVQANFEMSLL